jgi:hypothetical protein
VPISGNKGSFEWVSRQEGWANAIDVAGEQGAYDGVKRSNEMKMKTVPEVAQVKVPVTPRPDPSRFIIWDAGFYAEIKAGQFIVTRKISWRDGTKNPVPGARPSASAERALKRECENIWSKKWKIHREGCQRGDKCNCAASNGCCTFVITVVCEFAAGFDPVGWNSGPNSPSGWAPYLDANGTPMVAPKGPGWVWMHHYFPNPDHQKWWYSHEWWDGRQNLGNPTVVAAHEFGHLLGLHDEYPNGANLFDPINKIPVPGLTNVRPSIMHSGTQTFARHFEDMKKWFDSQASSVLGPTKLLEV